jgi:SAM-dependent methyltransferase
MSLRIKIGRFLIRLGAFIRSLPVVVMKPNDLIEFSRQTYSKPQDVESWAKDSSVDTGLSHDELDLINSIPIKTGNLLVLGVGGGREAIHLAKMGFKVMGVDFVGELVERAKENSIKRGVTIDGSVQEISQLTVPDGLYDVVWLSRAMYSCIPTRRLRVEMIRRIVRALKNGGYLLCQFLKDDRYLPSPKGILMRRLIGILIFGNREYEPGDTLWGGTEFMHAFSSDDQVRSEMEEGGLHVHAFRDTRNQSPCWVISKKE